MNIRELKKKKSGYLGFPLKELVSVLGPEGSPFGLVIQQRMFVWDADDIIRLIDSILKGYPIGTIVISSQKQIALDFGVVKRAIKKRDLIIYDGQQRLFALKYIFSRNGFILPEDRVLQGKQCKLFIDLENMQQALKGMKRLNNIKNPKSGDESDYQDDFAELTWNHLIRFKRSGRANVGLFPLEIASSKTDIDRVIDKKDRRFSGKHCCWVPFTDVVNGTLKRSYKTKYKWVLNKIQQRLKHFQVGIYVLNDKHFSSFDLDNLFIRINRSGVALTDAEAFFAEIKKRWLDRNHENAETAIGKLISSKSLFGLLDIVSILARTANLCTFKNDKWILDDEPNYLRIELRNFRPELISTIQELADQETKLGVAFRKSLNLVQRCAQSDLEYASRLVNPQMLGVFVMTYFRHFYFNPKKRIKAWDPSIPAFLFLATETGIMTHIPNFPRRVLSELWGERNNRKLYRRSLRRLLYDNPTIEKKLNDIRAKKTLDDQLLYLSLYQRVKFDVPHASFDSDHIVAYKWAQGKRKWRWKDQAYSIVNDIGNKWLVKSRTNRQWQELEPLKKFRNVTIRKIVGKRARMVYGNVVRDGRVHFNKVYKCLRERGNFRAIGRATDYFDKRKKWIMNQVFDDLKIRKLL